MASVSTEGRIFAAQLTRDLAAREIVGANALSPGSKTWRQAFSTFRLSLVNARSPTKAGALLRAAHERLLAGQKQGACFVNFFCTRSRSGSFEILTWEVAKHPLLNEGYDGILVRAYFCMLQRNGSGVAGPRARLAFISWHGLARMHQRSSVDIFTAKGVVAACGIAGYLLRESAKHANTELNYAAENMVCTGQLRLAKAEGQQYGFYDVATVLPLDEVPIAKREQGIAVAWAVHNYLTSDDPDPRGCADGIAVLPCRTDDFVSRTLKQAAVSPG